jgi:hypothetical protein
MIRRPRQRPAHRRSAHDANAISASRHAGNAGLDAEHLARAVLGARANHLAFDTLCNLGRLAGGALVRRGIAVVDDAGERYTLAP